MDKDDMVAIMLYALADECRKLGLDVQAVAVITPEVTYMAVEGEIEKQQG